MERCGYVYILNTTWRHDSVLQLSLYSYALTKFLGLIKVAGEVRPGVVREALPLCRRFPDDPPWSVFSS